jgi:hypothetical protein
MIWVLAFIFLYLVTAAVDIGHVNRLLERLVNPGPLKQAPQPPRAPRLVINLPPKQENPPAA